MTNGHVGVSAPLADRTWAMPPGKSLQKPINIIVVAGALSIFSATNATASSIDSARDPQRLASLWTNSGSVADVAPADRAFAAAVLEVRRVSGLTWAQLASLFGVDRRSVHFWASGRPMSAANAERLNRVLAVLRRADRGTPSATKAWLLSPGADGHLPVDLLGEGRFDKIVMPGAVGARQRPAPLSETAKQARAPRPPEELVAARQDRVHIETGRLIAAVPLKVSQPK